MSRQIVTARAGETLEVQDNAGISDMDVIRNAGFDTLLALCAGCCSCATCPVNVDPAVADARAPMAVEEDDLLDSSNDRQQTRACLASFVLQTRWTVCAW